MLRFSKVLIANRGEIASRIIRTTKQMGMKSLAICNEIDKNSRYVKEADEAVYVSDTSNVFLDIDKIIEIAKQNKVDAIHPGYGFLSENPEFPKRCKENGIKFVGPSYETMRLLSSKKDAKELAQRCGIPTIPGYSGSDQSTARLQEEINKIGYPVLLKASMGGGGRGMRIVSNSDHLAETISSCRNEAEKHFGDGHLLLEKFLPRTRHIEIQVFGDAHGDVVQLGERECSLQRRYQKLIEESPCFYLTDEERSRLYSWALALTQQSRYEGAATVEFLCDAATRRFYFMEVNTRLQVEHLVTQCVNQQIDLVELQLRIAQGESLRAIGVSPFSTKPVPRFDAPIYKHGPQTGRFAMECRVYNEDPANHFLPGDGFPRLFNAVSDPHTQIENNIPSSPAATAFDPLLLKIITAGNSRNEVIERMESALRRCVVLNVPTNSQMLLNALKLPKFRREGADSRLVDEFPRELIEPKGMSEFEVVSSLAAFLFARIPRGTSQNPWNSIRFFSNSAVLPRFGRTSINGIPFEYRLEPTRLAVRSPGKPWGTATPVEWLGEENGELRVRVGDEVVRNLVRAENPEKACIFPVSCTDRFSSVRYDVSEEEAEGREKEQATSEGASMITCPMPGSVCRVLVKNGEKVKKGDIVVVIEAMKMEHSITAPRDGVLEIGELAEKQFLKKGQSIFRVIFYVCWKERYE